MHKKISVPLFFLEAIRLEPGFMAIKAVREGKIYLIDEALVSRPTLRLLEGIRQIFGILYPSSELNM
ncbi:MAG: hypothetical protein J7L69_04355 [Desulfobulbaceae bacterium]|nr:hypothetical protein [Desulfobulbaceae bacterium]